MFDKIDRTHLWHKLLSQHVSTKLVKAFQAMYTTIKSCVRINKNMHSQHIISNIGVKQGDPASSLLCLFFLNDITTCINSEFEGIVHLDNLKLFPIGKLTTMRALLISLMTKSAEQRKTVYTCCCRSLAYMATSRIK